MSQTVVISNENIGLDDIGAFFDSKVKLSLDGDCLKRIKANREYLSRKIQEPDVEIYGVNTGFGSLCDVKISQEEIEQLQLNLIMSHACGQGDPIPKELSRLIVFLKIKNLSYGYSGVRPVLVERLIEMFNKDLIPVIYEQGSLGASGDLVPLAHMSLPLLGMGELWDGNGICKAEELLSTQKIEPLSLSYKEGLALINGTQFCLAFHLWASHHAERIFRWANLVSAMSLEAFLCSLDPFDAELSKIRNQEGQQEVANSIREVCEGSEILQNKYRTVQDPYSFRCIPQVHGASRDAINYSRGIAERELNAVTDNPNIFHKSDKVLSGGNFHAQPLALSLDFLSIALSELASISERRVYQLINGERGLPDYLNKYPGLNSGFMIPQYTAASIVSQNKQLCSPASVDSISSSRGQEDHVSMAANAATKTYRVVNNVYKVLAIELMTAAQALDFREGVESSAHIQQLRKAYREVVAFLDNDRILHDDIMATIGFIRNKSF